MICWTTLPNPNLNPLEKIWWAIEQPHLDIPLPSNANDLFEKIEQIWNNYPTDKLLKYIRSMPRVPNQYFVCPQSADLV